LTPKEAAAWLAVTVNQLHQLVSDGEMACIAVSRGQKRPRRRFTETDIQDFIEQRRNREVFLPSGTRRRRTNWTSDSAIVGFTARPAAEKLKKQKR
jgi:excisionase family DNA binding protein